MELAEFKPTAKTAVQEALIVVLVLAGGAGAWAAWRKGLENWPVILMISGGIALIVGGVTLVQLGR